MGYGMSLVLVKLCGMVLVACGVVFDVAMLSLVISDLAVLRDRQLNGARGRVAVGNLRRKLIHMALLICIGFEMGFAVQYVTMWIQIFMGGILFADAVTDWMDRQFMIDFIRGKTSELPSTHTTHTTRTTVETTK